MSCPSELGAPYRTQSHLGPHAGRASPAPAPVSRRSPPLHKAHKTVHTAALTQHSSLAHARDFPLAPADTGAAGPAGDFTAPPCPVAGDFVATAGAGAAPSPLPLSLSSVPLDDAAVATFGADDVAGAADLPAPAPAFTCGTATLAGVHAAVPSPLLLSPLLLSAATTAATFAFPVTAAPAVAFATALAAPLPVTARARAATSTVPAASSSEDESDDDVFVATTTATSAVAVPFATGFRCTGAAVFVASTGTSAEHKSRPQTQLQ